jgi:hypothetical protein
MIEVLLIGAAGVIIYLVAHTIVVRVEAWRGEPLGASRMVLFFGIFFVLLLGAFELIPRMTGA